MPKTEEYSDSQQKKIAELRKEFQVFDVDGNGEISKKELKLLLAKFGE